jgi:hypothetical protein
MIGFAIKIYISSLKPGQNIKGKRPCPDQSYPQEAPSGISFDILPATP